MIVGRVEIIMTKSTGGRGGGRWLRYVVMAGIADVEMWYVVGDEIDRVRTGAWLSSGGKSKGSIERCGRRDLRMKGGLEG